MNHPDTIVAIATPRGRGGIGIVRLSGAHIQPLALALLKQLPPPRQAWLCHFYDAQGQELDQGIALYFPAPQSFTGEAVLELHAHGSPVILEALIATAVQSGARLARPGEFTERAFLNGKIDLTQAEAVADLIASTTMTQARLAQRTLQGVFARHINALLTALTQLRAHIEVGLDFADEDVTVITPAAIATQLAQLDASLNQLLVQAQQGALVRDGLNVVIAGLPNAGKSSLLNVLTGQETAIVTAIAGTTRDVLHSDIALAGIPIRLTDTAGLHNSTDPIEQEGMRRARRAIAQADQVLWVRDVSVNTGALEMELRDMPTGPAVTIINNKIDLIGAAATVAQHAGYTVIGISTLTGAGIDLLRQQLLQQVNNHDVAETAFSAKQRHVQALQSTHAHIHAAAAALQQGMAVELIAEELRLAQQELGQITGVFRPDDLLTAIFADFCLGK